MSTPFSSEYFARIRHDARGMVERTRDHEGRLNALVDIGHATRAGWITDAELDGRPELVKTMSVAPPRGAGRVRLLEIPGVDLQACGGTHVANTREIGRLAVARIRSEGKRNKRVTLVFDGENAS